MLTKDFVVPSTGIHTHSFKKNTEDPLLSNITIKDWTDSTGTKSYDYLYNSKNSWEDYTVDGKGLIFKDEYVNKIKCTLTVDIKLYDRTYSIYKDYDTYSGVSVTKFKYRYPEVSHLLLMRNANGDICKDGDYSFATRIVIDESKKRVNAITGRYNTVSDSITGRTFSNVHRKEISPYCIIGKYRITSRIGAVLSYDFVCRYNAIFSAV